MLHSTPRPVNPAVVPYWRRLEREKQEVRRLYFRLGWISPREYAILELRYNENHDPENGRFTSGPGGVGANSETTKHQAAFVENAPCVTTPKKFTGYFLKPGAKHADQFFDVGYTADNPLQLRYDIAKQFDMKKAVDIETLSDGSKKFNIYMELGVTKKRTFRTGWIQDTPDSSPRIVTGFRDNGGKKND